MFFKKKTECKECKRLREELSRSEQTREREHRHNERWSQTLAEEYSKKLHLLKTENEMLKSLIEQLEQKGR